MEINPEVRDTRRVTWKEYELIEPAPRPYYRREITWNVFNEKANRFANLLLSRGVGKGDKVAILLMNCLEWLPIYFGILKTGAIAVPFNFRYSAEEIEYCVNLSETDVLVFGPEFIAASRRSPSASATSGCCSMWAHPARALQKIMSRAPQTAQASHRPSPSMTMMTQPSIFPQERPVFQKRSYMTMRA